MSTENQTNSELGPRERILNASLELFVQQGYFNTNVPDISKLSKCSVGSIYHHFLNKEEIAGKLYEDGIDQFRKELSKAISETASLSENIRALVVTFLGFAEKNLLLSRYLWLARHSEFLTNKIAKPTSVGFDDLGRKLTRAIRKGIRGKEIPVVTAEIFWTIVFGIPLSYVRDWLEGHTRSTPSEVAHTLANACWAALQGVKK